MTVIGIVAMGEMGSGIARRIVERGGRVLTSLAGRGIGSAERARQAGAEAVDDAALVESAEILLSVLPPARAGELAERFLPAIRGTARPPVLVDCNAIAPATLHALARPYLDAGLPVLDGSIIGPPPKPDGSSPRIYVSGPGVEAAAPLRDLGLDIRPLSGRLGEASALKMSYAGITKGFQALGAAMVLGAWRNGVGERFVDELKGSLAQHHAWLARELPRMYPKAYRWVGEMEEISKFLQPEDGSSEMLAGAAHLYEHIAADHADGPGAEIIRILDEFVRTRS